MDLCSVKGGVSSETYQVNQHYWWEYANGRIDKMVLNEIKVFANTVEIKSAIWIMSLLLNMWPFMTIGLDASL